MTRTQQTTLVAAILGSGIATIDGSIVNVALPAIEADLGGGLSAQQWVSNAYLLTLGSLILIGGSIGDIYGERRVFAIGLAAFGVFSVACALAPTIEVLIGARALQGAAARAHGSELARDHRRCLRATRTRGGDRSLDRMGRDRGDRRPARRRRDRRPGLLAVDLRTQRAARTRDPGTRPGSDSWRDLPASTIVPDPVPDCVETPTGSISSLAAGLHTRFESRCSSNNWSTFPSLPVDDPRIIDVFLIPEPDFGGSGSTVAPIRAFKRFYVTGWFHSSTAVGCPDNDVPPPPGCPTWPVDDGSAGCDPASTTNRCTIWGHFLP